MNREWLYHRDIYFTKYKAYRIIRYLVRTVIEYLVLFFYPKEEDLEFLKGLKSSETLIIVGNGPSLKDMDLNFLKRYNTLTVNAFHTKAIELNITPTFHMIEDNLPAFENRKELKNFNCGAIVVPNDLSWMYQNAKSHSVSFNFVRSALKYRLFRKFQFSKRFSRGCHWGGTVLYAALQLAYSLNYNRVILIGVDLTYKIPSDALIHGNIIQTVGADPNHFDGRYFGFGKKWHVPDVNRMQDAFDSALHEYQAANIELLYAGIGGNLKNLPRINHREL